MKTHRIPVIALGAAVLAAGLFVLFVRSSGTSPKPAGSFTDLSGWMQTIRDETPLSEVILPGSHDSGTAGMNWLGNTQNYSVGDQLKLGVRYFDLRVRNRNGKLVIYHGAVSGTDFLPLLAEIRDFIRNNPTEVLLLDFQHFDNSETEVLQSVTDLLGSEGLLAENDTGKSDLEFISGLKLGEVRGKCLVFFGEDKKDPAVRTVFARNNDACTETGMALDSYYSDANKKNSETYISEGLPAAFGRIRKKIASEGAKGIFVLQGQLTDGALIFGPYAKEKTHSANMSAWIRALPDSGDFGLVNVILRDFVDSQKVGEIIALNEARGCVKSSSLNDFRAALGLS